MKISNDVINISIKCSSHFIEKLRDQGLLFETIADALEIDREDIEEIDEDDCLCPNGGDEHNDCKDCVYSEDYYFNNKTGQCEIRKDL